MNYYVGTYQRKTDTNVLRLFNIRMYSTENPDGSGIVTNVDERTVGIDNAVMVTQIEKDKLYLQDRTAVHVYQKESDDFKTMFSKSGVYACVNMLQNLPEGYKEGDNDFKVDVSIKNSDFIVLQAIDIRTGHNYTMSKTFGIWGDWLPISSVWNPKVIDYGREDNVIIKTSERFFNTTDEITFNCRNEETRTATTVFEIPSEKFGHYKLNVKMLKRPNSSHIEAVTINGTDVQIDVNQDILLKTTSNEIVVAATGCQWTDFGMGWVDGTFPQLSIEFFNTESEVSTNLLVENGIINKELLPKETYIGEHFRIIELGNKLTFQKLVNSNWEIISQM